MLVKHVELLKNCDHFVVRLPRQVREFPSTSISPMVRVIVGRPPLPGSFVAERLPAQKHAPPPLKSQPLVRMSKAIPAEAMEDCGRGEGADQNDLKK